MKEISNFAGMDGFHWFIGRVEARVVSAGTTKEIPVYDDEVGGVIGTTFESSGGSAGTDPLRLGRVKVRVIGHHSEDITQLPTEHLPWATVMHPITSAGVNGVGSTANLIEGTTVFGFFLDALDKQHPVIIGTIPGRDSPGTNSDVRTSYAPQQLDNAPPNIDSIPDIIGQDIEDCLYKKEIYGKFDAASQSWPDMKEFTRGNNPKLRSMFNQIGFKNLTGENTSWCAAFVAHILKCAGYPSLPGNKLGAKNYQNYPGDVIWNGNDNPIPYNKFQKNDIMVFERPGRAGAGHVGLYHSTNKGKLRMVSGNAGNTLKLDRNGRNPNRFGRKLIRVIRPIKSTDLSIET